MTTTGVYSPSIQTDASASTHQHACTPPQEPNCYDLGLPPRGSKFWCLSLLIPHEQSATLPTNSSVALSYLLPCQILLKPEVWFLTHGLTWSLPEWQITYLHISLQPWGASEHRHTKGNGGDVLQLSITLPLGKISNTSPDADSATA